MLPTPDEVRAFLADTAADKRAQLIDRVLERPEFVDFWALQLGDLLQNRKESDHDVRGTKGVRAFHEWLRQQVAVNRPWDEMARDVLTATGTTSEQPGGRLLHRDRRRAARGASAPTVVASVAQTFLGTRIGCAQCHNHPLEKYTQDDYYHFAGFFSRVKLRAQGPEAGADDAAGLATRTPNAEQATRSASMQPRTGQVPQRRSRSTARRPTIKPGDDPRAALAAWMTDPKNEYFAGAMVNRLWAHFLGVGLVEPVDDLRASNPPTNPALWKALVKEFVGAQVRPQAPDAPDPQLADVSAQLGDAAGQREGHALLLALLRPPAAGRGAARRPARRHGGAGRVPRLPGRRAGGADARPGAEVVLPVAVRPVGAHHGLRLRAHRRGDDAAAAAPAERRQRGAQDSAPATAGWRRC